MAGSSPVAGQQQTSSGPGRGGGVVLRAVESISDLYRTPSFFQRAKAARAHNNSINDATTIGTNVSGKPPPAVGDSPLWRAATALFNDEDDWDPAWKELQPPSPPSPPPPPPPQAQSPPTPRERAGGSSCEPQASCCCPARLRLIICMLIVVSFLNLGVAACALYWAVVANNETRGLRGALAARSGDADGFGTHGPSHAASAGGLHLPGRHPLGFQAPGEGVW